ncbi:MAG: hypothetical protein QM813_08200 [Verrucomicrobiota bacterium]
MEFDWNNPPFEMGSSLTQREIEESFEDPFAIKLLPDSPRFAVQARFFNLGMSASGVRRVECVSDEWKADPGDLCPGFSAGGTVLLSEESGSNLVLAKQCKEVERVKAGWIQAKDE